METKDRLASIWGRVLNLSVIQETDSFADLGGDSISATMCLIEMRRLFGVELTYTILLEETLTFADLVSLIDRGGSAQTGASGVLSENAEAD